MNMNRRRFLILSGGIAAVPSLRWTGVLAQDATPSASPVADPATMFGPVQGNSPYKLAYMQVFPENPFWVTMKEAVEARAAEDGVTVDTFALPTASGVADQVSQMETAVTQQYDGIILGTVDAAGIVPGIEAANNAGIPVLAVDTAPAGGDFISLVQTDNVAAARL
ncbi:MAG: periplasmic binding protein/LacI transcriptional regulator, partial [Thermomicrobiales bacterium]|nr:periplasmic binding protein/LacI transcriptional regulator [Thermomicrobiales bacterium]